ncbi:hypothetical protein STEG23_029502 [Scotinomys teguina]
MRLRSWPGRVDPDPLGSARLGPAGPVYRRQQPSREEGAQEPNAAAWTAERNDPGTGHCEVRAQHFRTSGRDARGFREEVREDPSDFFRYRASKTLALEAALKARPLNRDPRERWPGRENRRLRAAARAMPRRRSCELS